MAESNGAKVPNDDPSRPRTNMAIAPTEAYARYKSQSDALLNFAVLVSYAVPTLRGEIQQVAAGTLASLPKPDFFHKSNKTRSSTRKL